MKPTTEELMQQLGQQYEGTVMKPLYTAEVTVTPGKEGHARMSGHARSSDGILDLDLAFPTELGGSGRGTNPEQLFAAGYAACFHGSLALVARRARFDVSKATVNSAVTIGRDPKDGGYILAAKLTVKMPGIESEKAKQLIDQAHKLCPYSKAIQGNVEVEIAVV